MKRLQLRANDNIAGRFEKVSSELRNIASDSDFWNDHWKKLKSFNLQPARKTMAELRALCEES